MKEHSKALQVEIVISEVLRWGVRFSLLLLAGGTVLCFLRGTDYGAGGGSLADLQRLITQNHPFPLSLGWLGRSLLNFEGQALLVSGLLLLIATPVIRVLVSIVAFALQKDRAYVLMTALVLLLLILSFALGKAA